MFYNKTKPVLFGFLLAASLNVKTYGIKVSTDLNKLLFNVYLSDKHMDLKRHEASISEFHSFFSNY